MTEAVVPDARLFVVLRVFPLTHCWISNCGSGWRRLCRASPELCFVTSLHSIRTLLDGANAPPRFPTCAEPISIHPLKGASER
ncbi:hypothetical protein NPIL_490651 [Nephila pilipes]|uniref:Uncharacterized protein n=1 Tax=Nephila pilipes TaxID=299642 RepID=A0A8X6PN82_NEPPI|nr:hypothetical protein NPIL_490651 [Nephila pilipes]